MVYRIVFIFVTVVSTSDTAFCFFVVNFLAAVLFVLGLVIKLGQSIISTQGEIFTKEFIQIRQPQLFLLILILSQS